MSWTLIGWVVAAGLFMSALVAVLPSAGPKRMAAALVAGALGVLFAIGWDYAASFLGLWTYAGGEPHAPWRVYAGFVFWQGAAFGLVGWYIIRRWGRAGAFGYLAAFAFLGAVRDVVQAVNIGYMTFSIPPLGILVDAVRWFLVGLIVQWLIRLIGDRMQSAPKRVTD